MLFYLATEHMREYRITKRVSQWHVAKRKGSRERTPKNTANSTRGLGFGLATQDLGLYFGLDNGNITV